MGGDGGGDTAGLDKQAPKVTELGHGKHEELHITVVQLGGPADTQNSRSESVVDGEISHGKAKVMFIEIVCSEDHKL